jgi:hypothetical protein
VIFDLRSFQQHVEGNHTRAVLQDPEISDQKMRQIGELERDPVAGPHTVPAQSGREAIR